MEGKTGGNGEKFPERDCMISQPDRVFLPFLVAVIFCGVEHVFPQVWGHEELWRRCTELLGSVKPEIPWFPVCWWVGSVE